jgi:hypothetical protein
MKAKTTGKGSSMPRGRAATRHQEIAGAEPDSLEGLHDLIGNQAIMAAMQGEAADGAPPGQQVPFRGRLEMAFGADLADIPVRQGEESESERLGLHAEGAYRDGELLLPKNPPLELVAHETAHALQDRSSGSSNAAISVDGDAETDAHTAAQDVAAGRPATLRTAADGGTHLWPWGVLTEMAAQGQDDDPSGDAGTDSCLFFPSDEQRATARQDLRTNATALTQQVQAGTMSSCEAMATLTEQAQPAYSCLLNDDEEGMVEDLSWVLSGTNEWATGTDGTQVRGFDDSGFQPEFQDGSNQVQHFMGGLQAGYQYGGWAYLLHPVMRPDEPADTALNDQSTWAGWALSGGDLDADELDDFIRSDVCAAPSTDSGAALDSPDRD